MPHCFSVTVPDSFYFPIMEKEMKEMKTDVLWIMLYKTLYKYCITRETGFLVYYNINLILFNKWFACFLTDWCEKCDPMFLWQDCISCISYVQSCSPRQNILFSLLMAKKFWSYFGRNYYCAKMMMTEDETNAQELTVRTGVLSLWREQWC